jgi:hypothetical protein
MSGDHDLWYVKTADGDVDRLTLDQLDEAFNAGHIDENVTVLPAGQNNWVRLGTLLGLDQPATPSPVSFAPSPNSMRPVSIDLSDDHEFAQLNKKSRKGVGIVAVAAVLLIPAGILGANRMHLGSSVASTPNVAAAAIQAPPPVTAAPPPPAPVPPPPVTATATTSADNRFNDDQKAKLAAADKALDAKIKSKQKARISGGGHHSAPKYKSQGFTSGGNKFDPLNSGI